MFVAVGIDRGRFFLGQRKASRRLSARGKTLSVAADVRLQIDPSDGMIVLHRMVCLTDLNAVLLASTVGTARLGVGRSAAFLGGCVLFVYTDEGGVLCIGFGIGDQMLHFRTAAGEGTAAVMDHADDGAAGRTMIKSLAVVQIHLLPAAERA